MPVIPATPWTANSTNPYADQSYQAGDRPTGAAGSYTIAGTGFGTKDSTTPIFEDFEGQAVGAVSANFNDMKFNGGFVGPDISIISTGALSQTRSMKFDFSKAADASGFPQNYVTLSGTRPKIYHSSHIRYDGASSGGTNIWKVARGGAGALYSGTPKVSAEYTSGSSSTPTAVSATFSVSSPADGGTDGTDNTAATSPATAYPTATTLFYEFEFDAGTLNGNDANFYERVSGLDTITFENRSYLTTANSDLPTWMMAANNSTSGGTNTLTFISDNFYSDESRARVVMTDNATYASSTKWAVQPTSTWSNTEVVATKKRQYFDVGDTCYLHVFDDDGILVDSGPSFLVTEDNV